MTVGFQTGQTAGTDFTVWGDSNGANNVTPFVADTPTTSRNNFNPVNFMDDAEIQGNVNNSRYLTSIQAGVEPRSGGNGLAINNFSATVNGSRTISSAGLPRPLMSHL